MPDAIEIEEISKLKIQLKYLQYCIWKSCNKNMYRLNSGIRNRNIFFLHLKKNRTDSVNRAYSGDTKKFVRFPGPGTLGVWFWIFESKMLSFRLNILLILSTQVTNYGIIREFLEFTCSKTNHRVMDNIFPFSKLRTTERHVVQHNLWSMFHTIAGVSNVKDNIAIE